MASAEERFWAKVQKGPDCWLWTGSGVRGYGRFRRDGKSCYAHRYAYELFVGPIPDGLTIDHLCRNKGCVNPAHLEAVSLRENILRGEGIASRNARKTHCPKGHSLDDGPRDYLGRRWCRKCRAERDRRNLRVLEGET